MNLSFSLPSRLDAPRRARAALVELEGEVPPTLAAKTPLLVSELVSDAIRHGEGEVSVEVEMSPEKVRATVIDQGNGFPTPPPDPSIAATTSAGKIGDGAPHRDKPRRAEVGDLDEALEFYGAVFEFELRGRIGDQMAFLDMGDQFLALSAGRRQAPDEERHVGLVVDDKEATRRALDAAGAEVLPARGATSATRGATTSRSSSTPIFSSQRRPRSCAPWASRNSRSPRRHIESSARRELSKSHSGLELDGDALPCLHFGPLPLLLRPTVSRSRLGAPVVFCFGARTPPGLAPGISPDLGEAGAENETDAADEIAGDRKADGAREVPPLRVGRAGEDAEAHLSETHHRVVEAGRRKVNPMVNEARILAVVPPSDAATTQVKRVMIVPATITLTSDATMVRSPSVSAAVPTALRVGLSSTPTIESSAPKAAMPAKLPTSDTPHMRRRLAPTSDRRRPYRRGSGSSR